MFDLVEIGRTEACNFVINVAEYVAVSEVCPNIMLIKIIMDFLQLKVEKPVKVYYDNVVAEFMENKAKQIKV